MVSILTYTGRKPRVFPSILWLSINFCSSHKLLSFFSIALQSGLAPDSITRVKKYFARRLTKQGRHERFPIRASRLGGKFSSLCLLDLLQRSNFPLFTTSHPPPLTLSHFLGNGNTKKLRSVVWLRQVFTRGYHY